MNADTGRIYDLPELRNALNNGTWWPPVGQPIMPSDLPSDDDGDERLEELRAAIYDRDEPVVMVSAAVAQRARLGDRELRRRKRRQRGKW